MMALLTRQVHDHLVVHVTPPLVAIEDTLMGVHRLGLPFSGVHSGAAESVGGPFIQSWSSSPCKV